MVFIFGVDKYRYNQTYLKVYSDKLIKLSCVAVTRTSGLEVEPAKERCSVNDEKLLNNISRAKSRIYELAICNDWQWFFTGTLDPQKYDRTDLCKFAKDFKKWLSNYNRKLSHGKIDYILIPELHDDGKCWHMHGFLSGLPVEHLKRFELGDVMGKYIAEKVKKGEIVYNWIAYAKKFGFCDLEPIKDKQRASSYITKYITKHLAHCVTKLNAQMYYCTRGLKRAETIKAGYMFWENIQPTYSNDYCTVACMNYDVDVLQTLCDAIY